MSDARLDDFRWLASREGQARLDELTAGGDDTLRQAARLRSELSLERTHLLLEQAELRRRAAQKFHDFNRIFCTRRGLEQSTGEAIANYKAQRFARFPRVADLCCGIGGDLRALAARRSQPMGASDTIGLDRDPVMAILAEANCRWSHLEATVHVGDVENFQADACDAWHVDPDRRSTGSRTSRIELGSPGLEVLDRLLTRNPNGAIKLAPAAVVPDAWQRAAELEWISHQRECRQLVAWFGGLDHRPTTTSAGLRRATQVDVSGAAIATFSGEPKLPMPTADRIGTYLVEPDGAVLAAQLTGAMAQRCGLAAVAPNCVYLTGDELPQSALLTVFEVVDVQPLDERRLKKRLRQLDVGRIEVKKRGVAVDPARVAKQLSRQGKRQATLIVFAAKSGATAIVANRITCSDNDMAT